VLDGRLSNAVVDVASRRGFLARVGRLLLVATGGSVVAAAVRAQAAEAYHFCGHLYTTGSCPHPTGLPRIDAHGLPLRAADGKAVDDLGRPIDGQGRPVDESGQVLVTPGGDPLPPAPRTPVCDSAAAEFGFKPYIDGSWHRCCNGRVRKLVDCCGYVTKRVNGDAALTGYCYSGRRVFCVVYYDTKVPC
jgi:hypothetical protein